MTLEELANRLDDAVAALERIAAVLEDVTANGRVSLRREDRHRRGPAVMDEHREEREEREREERDDAREAAAERAYWQDVGLEPAERVTLETWRWSR